MSGPYYVDERHEWDWFDSLFVAVCLAPWIVVLLALIGRAVSA